MLYFLLSFVTLSLFFLLLPVVVVVVVVVAPCIQILTTIDIYNPSANTWSSINWGNATSDGVAFGYGDSLYLVGGYDSSYNSVSKLERYDTVTGKWDYSLPSMPHARGDIQILEHLGYFYVFGGYSMFGYNTTSQSCALPTKYVEAFNPQTKKWKSMTSMLYARADCTVGSIGNELFVIGGESLSGDDTTW
jgi:N-acetylneuraminic acid mutarotase